MIDFLPVQQNELLKLVKKIDISKSSNIMNINNKLFRDCLSCMLPQVSFLYNLIPNTAVIPPTWKFASITSIFKTGSVSDIANYRPISLLPQIVKTLEKLIHERSYAFFNRK